MEDVLDLYTEPPDPSFPVISFDESPTQLIGESGYRYRRRQALASGVTTSIAATALPTCLCSWMRIGRGGT